MNILYLEESIKNKTTLADGLKYFLSKHIKSLEQLDSESFLCTVSSQIKIFEVIIEIYPRSSIGELAKYNCTCTEKLKKPDNKSVCKHIVAAILEIRKQYSDLFKSQNINGSNKENVDSNNKLRRSASQQQQLGSLHTSKSNNNKLQLKKILKKQKKMCEKEVQKNLQQKNEFVSEQNCTFNQQQCDIFKQEIECQICLDDVQKPILMPCHVHNICSDCLINMIEIKKKKNPDMYNFQFFCQVCGIASGTIDIPNIHNIASIQKYLIINKSLIKIITAYNQEKDAFSKKISCLNQKIHDQQQFKLQEKLMSSEINKVEQNTNNIDIESEISKKNTENFENFIDKLSVQELRESTQNLIEKIIQFQYKQQQKNPNYVELKLRSQQQHQKEEINEFVEDIMFNIDEIKINLNQQQINNKERNQKSTDKKNKSEKKQSIILVD